MTSQPLRLVFAGTPAAAVPSLNALHAAGHDIALVVTRPDAPLGRRRVLTPSPVAAAAEEKGLAVLRTARLDDAASATIAAVGADLAVVVAYGGLVREPLLSAPPHGWINLHFSLLPRWRGAAPVQHALIAGDATLGTAVFSLVPELDAGDVYDSRAVPLPPTITAGEALGLLAEAGAAQLTEVVAAIAAGTARVVPQTGEATFAPKLTLADAALDLTRPAGDVLARFRGVTPEPGAHVLHHGARVKLHELVEAASDVPVLAPGATAPGPGGVWLGTGTEAVLITRIQPAGKAAMNAADWYRGQREAVSFDIATAEQTGAAQ